MARQLNGQSPRIALHKQRGLSLIMVYSPKTPRYQAVQTFLLTWQSRDYRRSAQQCFGLNKVVITQPNAYQTDNTCMLEALKRNWVMDGRVWLWVPQKQTEVTLQTTAMIWCARRLSYYWS